LKEETVNVLANTYKNPKDSFKVTETLEYNPNKDIFEKTKFSTTLEDVKNSFQKSKPLDIDTKSDDFRFKKRDVDQQE